MEQVLSQFGVKSDTLTQKEKKFLDEHGFLFLGQLLTSEQVSALNIRLDQLLLLEGENAGSEVFDSKFIRHPKEEGADRLANLVNKGPVFDILFTHPRLLAGISHVLGENIKLSSLNYRAAKPGMGLQKMHVDWHEAVMPGNFKVCNSIWLLDDFCKKNGATRIVPGTHLVRNLPQDVMEDTYATHPREILLEAPAGTVVIFNSHTWHGGTTNQTKQPRRAIHSYFCQRDLPQQTDQRRFILPETKDRLPAEALYLLDV